MRFFDREADIIQPDSEHNAFMRTSGLHQVFRMTGVSFKRHFRPKMFDLRQPL